MTAKIWCLFSIDNNYDQPSNNLVAWYKERPSIRALADLFRINFLEATDEQVLFLAGLVQKKSMRLDDTNFRIEEIEEGKNSDE